LNLKKYLFSFKFVKSVFFSIRNKQLICLELFDIIHRDPNTLPTNSRIPHWYHLKTKFRLYDCLLWCSYFHYWRLKLRCDERFTHAFTAYGCVFKEITLVDSNQGNFFENATVYSKRMRKTLVATQLYIEHSFPYAGSIWLFANRWVVRGVLSGTPVTTGCDAPSKEFKTKLECSYIKNDYVSVDLGA